MFYGIKSYKTCSNAVFAVFWHCIDTVSKSSCRLFITLSMIRCSKLAHKSAVQV